MYKTYGNAYFLGKKATHAHLACMKSLVRRKRMIENAS